MRLEILQFSSFFRYAASILACRNKHIVSHDNKLLEICAPLFSVWGISLPHFLERKILLLQHDSHLPWGLLLTK